MGKAVKTTQRKRYPWRGTLLENVAQLVKVEIISTLNILPLTFQGATKARSNDDVYLRCALPAICFAP